MSTRSTIWLGEDEGRTLHIYWELADRTDKAAPICIAIDTDESCEELVIRLPREMAEKLLTGLAPEYKSKYGWDVL